MIVLDTNVVSELVRGPSASHAVIRWMRHLTERPAVTVITRAEMLAGVAALPEGSRRQRLESDVRGAMDDIGMCLPLTAEAADLYAQVLAIRSAQGRPIAAFDALIGAVCLDAGTILATRNTKDFEGLGLELINPWDASA